MTAILESLTALNRWQAAFVLFAAGSLMALGFAPFHLWPVIFVSLPIFYAMLVSAPTYGRSLLYSFAYGYGYSMAGTWWIGNALLIDAAKFGWMLPFSILGLSAAMAWGFVVLGYFIYRLRARMTPLLFALLWLVVEILRSIGMFGFPWNLVGYMGLASLNFAQVASIVGVYGVSLIIVWVGLLPVYWMTESLRRKRAIATACILVLLLGGYGFGAMQLSAPSVMTETKLRVVQPNIPQEVKGTREGMGYATQTLEWLSELKTKNGAPDITIWPETTYPYTVRADFPNMLPDVQGTLLTGAMRAEGVRPHVQIWNSLVAMNAQGKVLASYDKHQLVPFGEFVPLRSVLPLDKITPGDIDFSRGVGPRTLTVGELPSFSSLVCYEVIFPWMAVDERNRPDWMLNVTNDGWYGVSPGPYQHFEMARMRAIEQGIPLVRAANSGVSAVFDGRGRVIGQAELNKTGIIETRLPKSEKPTIFAIINAILMQP